MLDNTLVDGKAYSHGVTYRTSSATINSNSSGNQSILAGIRASSVKSLFARFYDASGGTVGSVNGKYDSKCPLLNSVNYNVGGLRFPQQPINCLLQPAQAFRDTQMAVGAFNNSQFQSCIIPSQYCKLAAGGSASGLTSTTQDGYWNLGTVGYALSSFIFGENVEVCARRGLLSGLNATSAPIFLEMNIAAALTNNVNVYVQAMIDHIIIHDVKSGDIQIRC